MEFLTELIRRNVHRMAGLYLVGAWLLVQVAATILPVFGFGATAVRATVIVLAVGLVPALVCAWVFELTPEGLKRESEIDRSTAVQPHAGRRMDRLITVVLALALAYFAFDKFVLSQSREAVIAESARQEGRSEALVESYGGKSIAVLPFTDLSPGRDQEYMSDGLAEELLNLLARIPELRVISRSSAFAFKGQNIETPEIARRLNVAHVLQGSVRKSGDTLRITALLIEARSDTHLWSQSWDRPLGDIFAVQDEIAAAVVEQLRIKLLGELPSAKHVNPEAYALVLQARQLAHQRTREGYAHSIALFQQALALDPAYVAALNGLARTYRSEADLGLRPVAEGYALARETIASALALDPDDAASHAGLGWIAMHHDGDLAAAARHYQRALALAPADPEILRNAGTLAQNLGRLEQAIALKQYAVARDPVNPGSHASLGLSCLYAARHEQAIASYRRALQLSPGYIGARYGVARALLAQGDAEAALVEIGQEADEGWRLFGQAIVNHALGRGAESDAALEETIRKYAGDSAYNIAYMLARRGEADRAFEWLDKAIANRDPGLSHLTVEPLFSAIHADPRWLQLLRRLGYAPEQLAAIPFEVKLPVDAAALL